MRSEPSSSCNLVKFSGLVLLVRLVHPPYIGPVVSGASANILRNRSFQNLRSAEAAITGSVYLIYLDTKCCHMWRLEGCHDVSFICTARELSNCFRTSRTSSLVRISTCRHSHVCIILRWKVDIFCALACLFQVLFR